MSMLTHRQLILAVLAASAAGGALASSHREAPFISTRPSVDGTDFYMFNSYESGRAGYVTLIANYVPLQDPQGGPNYFALDDNALYEISVDNTGSGKANLTFQFRFSTVTQGLAGRLNNILSSYLDGTHGRLKTTNDSFQKQIDVAPQDIPCATWRRAATEGLAATSLAQ